MASSSSRTTIFWSRGKDVLSMLVIPLLLWGVKLEVTLAVQGERMASIEADVADAEGMSEGIQRNTVQLATLTAQLEAANGRLDVIKDLLSAH